MSPATIVLVGTATPEGAEVRGIHQKDVSLVIEGDLDDVAGSGDDGVVKEAHTISHFLPAPFLVGSASVAYGQAAVVAATLAGSGRIVGG